MTVVEVLIEYMKANGYTALCSDGCGCGINDLSPCDNFSDCSLGYEIKSNCNKCDVDECDGRGETDVCYTTNKEKAKKYGLPAKL